jgi:hypothetical protein
MLTTEDAWILLMLLMFPLGMMISHRLYGAGVFDPKPDVEPEELELEPEPDHFGGNH